MCISNSPACRGLRQELRGFERVRLEPGQKQTVTFTLPAEKLAFYDVESHGFRVELGAFDVLVGGASDDIREVAQLDVVGPPKK